jgi:hypothetical protein
MTCAFPASAWRSFLASVTAARCVICPYWTGSYEGLCSWVGGAPASLGRPRDRREGTHRRARVPANVFGPGRVAARSINTIVPGGQELPRKPGEGAVDSRSRRCGSAPSSRGRRRTGRRNVHPLAGEEQHPVPVSGAHVECALGGRERHRAPKRPRLRRLDRAVRTGPLARAGHAEKRDPFAPVGSLRVEGHEDSERRNHGPAPEHCRSEQPDVRDRTIPPLAA